MEGRGKFGVHWEETEKVLNVESLVNEVSK